MTDMTHVEQVAHLDRWCAERDLTLTLEGECGFGRECVGITGAEGNYVDYLVTDANGFPVAEEPVWRPVDAYHKHPCLAVLGRGQEAVDQLYRWVVWLAENGWTTTTEARTPTSFVDALLNGGSVTRLVRGANGSG